MLKGVVIDRGSIGANVAGKPFKTSGLITTGVAVSGGLALGDTYKLLGVADAEALGLDADYDTTNNVVLYRHIVDFYDEAGEGTPLYLMVLAQTVTLAQLLDDTGSIYAKKLLVDAGGEIYRLAVGFNPESGYTETATDGLNSDVRAAIVKAQALHDWSLENFMEAQIILEGRAWAGTASTSLDLRSIPASPSGIQQNPHVTICIAQDYDFAETLTGLAQKHAAIGKLLGTSAACEVNQDVGEVGAFNLTRETKSRWTTAGLSNHTKVSANQSQISTLDTKGYVFADTYVGVSGYRWNGDHTCAPIIVDSDGNMNEHKMSYGLTMNHAGRRLRAQLLPEVRSVKPVDPATGKMATGVVKYLEGLGNDVFDDMAADGHLTQGITIVDPDSDILVAKEVGISFNIVPYGTIGRINGTLNLKISN